MKSTSQFVFLLLFSVTAAAQCTVVIPANTIVITGDTTIDCSFMPGNRFLVCTGASVTVTGNSTCFNHFYMENASVVTFRDTFPGAPYGLFSFYIRGIAILNFNDDSPVSFGIIDTLVYEPTALLIDTGHIFQHRLMCPTLTFDYSLMPTGNPCGTTEIEGDETTKNFIAAPVPFSDHLDIIVNGWSQICTVQIFDLQGSEVERYEVNGPGKHRLAMRNDWSGIAYVEMMEAGKVFARKRVARIDQD